MGGRRPEDGYDSDWVTDGWAATALPTEDPGRPFGYLLSSCRSDYVSIMGVLEQAVDQLTPQQVACELAEQGVDLPVAVVTQRLRALGETFLAASGRPDSEIERYQELRGSRWRYGTTPRGRQVQRLWSQMAAEGVVQREIALDGLARIVDSLGRLDDGGALAAADAAVLAGGVFVEHDHLDAALVGQADLLAELAHRFDLGAEDTVELKGLLVDYATHVVVHLDRAVVLVHHRLKQLRPRFAELAGTMRGQSRAGALVARGVLTPARGHRVEDWEQLLGWFSPGTGKAARFGLQLVRAIPMMHINLRRHQSAAGPGSLRAKALSLAVGCQDPQYGQAVLRASLGDHPWMKLHTVAEAEDGEAVSWHEGPRVPALAMLRATGQSRPRGKVTGRRPREEVAQVLSLQREQRRAAQEAAVAEVLAGRQPLSESACRAALKAVIAAVRTPEAEGLRTGSADGLGCTLTAGASGTGRVDGERWSVLLPGRSVGFHLPRSARVSARRAAAEVGAGAADPAVMVLEVAR
ncbi:DUF2397 family protein [Streptomyces sp. NBC_00724]|uniref:DUF2397 family protein n=1 Tax=Streptomyces sp. NBC_00724 TaxID=2975812 RepID=UPI002ED633ED|nr:DUF2397 domain-containing protein [Streptomyces sp. NBC_00724]